MSNLSPFNAGGKELQRLPRSTSRALEAVRGNAVVQAAQMEAAAFITHIALHETEMLSMQEALLVQRCPHAAGRAQAIVDTFTAVAVSGVARTRFSS